MKKLSTFVFALFTAAALTSCGPTSEDAINYNDSLINEINKVIQADNKFVEAEDKGGDEMKSAHQSLIQQVNTALENIKKVGPFDKKSDFLDASVKYLTTYKGVVENEYKQMVDISSKPDDQKTEDDDAAYNKAQDASRDKMKTAEDEFTKVQQDFSKQYKFKFKSDSL
jgi:hypothetical protein